nr:anoctamin-5-like isoform X2 [Onthophagus taurus]
MVLFSKKNALAEDEQFDLPIRDPTGKDYESDEVLLMLAYTKHDMMASLKRSRIKFFLESLQKSGLVIDSVQSLTHRSLVFVKITGDQEVLRKYAPSLGIPLHCENPFFQETDEREGYMRKVLTSSHKNLGNAKVSRSMGNIKNRDITVSEKIQIMYQILKFAKYGFDDDDVGINRLLSQGTLQTIYPTHERSYHTLDAKGVTDIFLLKTFWGSWSYIFSGQPTFLIQNYYGAEVGFYFAYLNHFAKMLIPASCLGIATFLFGIISMYTSNNFKSEEVCNSDMVLCPTCVHDVCNYTSLKYSCHVANFNHMIDNQTTVVYGILISIWSTVSFEMWKRQQSSLAYQWNVYSAHVNTSVRPQYETSATLRKLSPITGEWEPYEDTAVHICHSFLSILALAAMGGISILGIVIVTIKFNDSVVSLTLAQSQFDSSNKYHVIGAKTTSSLLSVLLMIIFDFVYKYIAVWLVRFENPRTEQEYDNSYILKIYFLTFVNSFGVAVYIAFVKHRYAYYPGHESEDYHASGRCDPTGCAEHLCIHIFVVLLTKCVLKDLVNFLVTYIRVIVRKYKMIHDYNGELPPYEQEYYLKKTSRFFLINEYKEIAPLIVLLHTLVEIRNNAVQLLRNYRRPIPICVNGIGAWMQVFMAMTHLGVVTNAIVIGWTMTFVPTAIYTHSDTHLPYYENRFSIFNTSDYPSSIPSSIKNIPNQPQTCRYPSLRYPPDDPDKYILSGAFWHEITWVMAFIIIFEHVVLAITSIIAYSIPDIPVSIQQMMEHENLKLVKENYKKIGDEGGD